MDVLMVQEVICIALRDIAVLDMMDKVGLIITQVRKTAGPAFSTLLHIIFCNCFR